MKKTTKDTLCAWLGLAGFFILNPLFAIGSLFFAVLSVVTVIGVIKHLLA